jgi:hypothetical protein
MNVHTSSCKVLIIFVSFNRTGISLTDFQKTLKVSNFMQIRPVTAELFHTWGWTGRYDEANSRF